MAPTLAVDGDIIAYRTAAVCEDLFERNCRDFIDDTLMGIAGDSGVCDMRIYLTGQNNFRRFIASTTPYKGNRVGVVKPQYLGYCHDYLVDKYKAIAVNGYEADDCIASDMTANCAFHCGVDKDILQIAGRHYNYVEKTWQDVTPEQAKINLFRQVLTGDTSDNVPGLPKVGDKRASDAIADHATAFDDALETYRKVCAERLPEIDPDLYFVEQLTLIAMHKNVRLEYVNTIHIEPWTLQRIRP